MDLSVQNLPPPIDSIMQEKIIACNICEFKCDNYAELLNHLKNNMDEQHQSSFMQLTHETQQENGDKLECEICHFTCSDQHSMDAHMTVHTDVDIDMEDKEDGCSVPVLNGSGLNQGDAGIFKCDECPFACSDESFLTIHKVMHSFTKQIENATKVDQKQRKDKVSNRKSEDAKPFMCEICFKTFTVKSSLKQHMRLHTGNTPHRCHICDHPFSQKSHLDRHIKTHTGEKKHKCQLCEYATSEIANLMSHMRKHTGERPYKCEYCEASFKQKIGLDRHRKRHLGEKSYKCLLCDYACYDSGALVRHTRVHTGEKPYQCPECSYTCASSNNLVSHRKIHTDERPYKCEYCGHAVRRRGDLRRHTKRKHPDKPIPEHVEILITPIPVRIKPEKNSDDDEKMN